MSKLYDCFLVNVLPSFLAAIIGFTLGFLISSLSRLENDLRHLEIRVHELCGYVEISNCFDKHFLYGDKCVYTCNDGRTVENPEDCNRCKELEVD